MAKRSDIYKSGLPMRAILVYVYLCDRANTEGQCWPSQRRISKDLDISMRTVSRAVKELRDAGFIETNHRIKTDGSWGSLMYNMKLCRDI